MADPIPSADAALLAAQARAGQAGVDAYQAAKIELTNQRQQALQQAMQQAAMRGAPAGAMESIAGTMTQPYDQGIAAMSAGSANFQSEMAQRDRRSTDYNTMVQQARSLIPGQVEMVVAPIRAQGEYNLRSQQIAGDRSVAEIQANTELEKAKLAASIAAAKKAASQLTAGETSSALNDETARLLGGVSGLGDLISGTQAAMQQVDARNAATIGQAAANSPAAAKSAADAFWAMQGAQYTAKGIAEDKTKPAGMAATGAAPIPSPFDPERPPGLTDAQWQEHLRQIGYTPLPQTNYAARQPGDPNRYNAANAQVAALSSQASKNQGVQNQLAAQALMAILNNVNQNYNAFTTVDPKTGNRIGLTPRQLQGLDPFSQQLVSGLVGQGSLLNSDQFNTALGGPQGDIATMQQQAANSQPILTGGGVGSMYSSDALRAAMAKAGQNLMANNPTLTEADIQNAMPDKMPSIYDFLAGRNNQPTSQQRYSDAEKAQAGITSTNKTNAKADDDSADQALLAKYGNAATGKGIGTPTSVLAFISGVDPTTGQSQPQTAAQFDEAMAAITDITNNWTKAYQKDLGEQSGPKVRRVLQGYQTAMGGKLSPQAISIAMAMSGY